MSYDELTYDSFTISGAKIVVPANFFYEDFLKKYM